MSVERARFEAGAENNGSCQPHSAAQKVNLSAAAKIEESHVFEPPVFCPDPVGGHWIDEPRDGCRGDDVCQKSLPARHRAPKNGGSVGYKCKLGKEAGHIGALEAELRRTYKAGNGAAGAETQAVANDSKGDGTCTEIDEVFEKDMRR